MPSRVSLAAFEHVLRTTIAAVVSLLVARAFRLPEFYWAAITTMVVTQSTVASTMAQSVQRLLGTAIGAAAGAVLAGRLGSSVLAFGAGLFALGIVCVLLRLDWAAYRFAGIALIIVELIARKDPAWVIASHRFFEVAIGIAVGLAMAALWPEAQMSPRA